MTEDNDDGGAKTPPVFQFASGTPDEARRMFYLCLKDDKWAEGKPTRKALERLATHSLMTNVWKELLRVHPDQTPIYRPLVFSHEQMPGVLLCYWSVLFHVDPWLPTRSHAQTVARNMRRAAKRLKEAACDEFDDVSRQNLLAAAEKADRQGRSLQKQIRTVIRLPERQRIPADVAGTICGLIVAHKDLYGRAIDGVTAKLIEVIHNFEVSSSAIQNYADSLK